MKKNIINVDGSGYIVLGNGEEFYVCMKIIDVETYAI